MKSIVNLNPELGGLSLSENKLVLKTVEDKHAILTINRPKAMNIIDNEVLEELFAHLQELNQDEKVKCVIITGSGEKAFIGGANVKAMKEMDPVEAKQFSQIGQEVLNFMESTMSKPVIAAINGHALGGGLEVAMAADIRVASENAKLGAPEINLGIIPGYGGTYRLPQIVGAGKAKELIYTGKLIDAQEAEQIDLVDKVTSQEELMNTVRELAQKITSKSLRTLNFAKEAVNMGLQEPSDKAVQYERNVFSLCFATEDQKEGMSAFLEKRDPEFVDR